MISVNQGAARIVDQMVAQAEALGVQVSRLAGGARVLDCGVAAPGGLQTGKYLAEDIVNLETGQIYGEAGDELDAKLLAAFKEAKVKEFPILDIDHVTIGAFIRNTLNVDKNSDQQGALMDIYRVMRPGEPPTLEAATNLFNLFGLIPYNPHAILPSFLSFLSIGAWPILYGITQWMQTKLNPPPPDPVQAKMFAFMQSG